VRRTADENALLHTAPATNALLPHTIAGRVWSERRTFIRYGKPFCGGESSDREMASGTPRSASCFTRPPRSTVRPFGSPTGRNRQELWIAVLHDHAATS
jgi:hypothetical protein